MFRDPRYFLALRRAGRAGAAHLSVAQGLGRRLQHRRGGLLARDPAARGRPARAHASSTRPTSIPESLQRRRGRHLPARAHRAVQPQLPARRRHAARCRTTTPAAYARRAVRPRAAAAHRLRRSQPGHRQRVLRGPPGVVPQRADLLQPRSCRTAPSGCSATSLVRAAASSAWAATESLQFSAHADAFDALSRRASASTASGDA